MEHLGRPPFYNDPEELRLKIDEYFSTGVKKKKIKIGKAPKEIIVEVPVPTITGLCIFLGFESRQSFYDYQEKEGFTYTIKRARLFIENEYEELLQTGNVTGAIFALKNFGWIDKSEIDQKTTLKDERVDTSHLTEEELRILIEMQRKIGSS